VQRHRKLKPRLILGAALALLLGSAQAESLRFCDRSGELSARQQDRLLRFAAVVKQELDASGDEVALVARSGLNLARFGLRYSHAGVSLKASANGPWSVRQLYYACDEGRPRIYDQGMGGFLSGTDDPALGYAAIVLLPRAEGRALAHAALDRPRLGQLLAARYSANAYVWSLRYQNCNQWVVELLAAAWGGLAAGPELRAEAQRWLAAHGYAPPPVAVGSHLLMFAAGFVPWLRFEDHPEDDRFALQFRTSVPESIEGFVRARLPGAQRIELCHDERHIVVHRGWTPIAEGCRPGPGDRVIALD